MASIVSKMVVTHVVVLFVIRPRGSLEVPVGEDRPDQRGAIVGKAFARRHSGITTGVSRADYQNDSARDSRQDASVGGLNHRRCIDQDGVELISKPLQERRQAS